MHSTQSIHKYLRGASLTREYEATEPRLEVPPVEISPEIDVFELTRPEMPKTSIQDRCCNFSEVELGYSKQLRF